MPTALIWPMFAVVKLLMLLAESSKYSRITATRSELNSSKHPALISWMNLDLVTSVPWWVFLVKKSLKDVYGRLAIICWAIWGLTPLIAPRPKRIESFSSLGAKDKPDLLIEGAWTLIPLLLAL